MGLIGSLIGGALQANKAIKQNKAQKDDNYETVTVNNLYSINVPSFLSPTTKLSRDASLQYWNKTLDVSFIVIEEPKKELEEALKRHGKDQERSLVENLVLISLSTVFEDLNKVKVDNFITGEVNGLNGAMLNAFQKSTFFKDALYGTIAAIEGKEHVYQLIILSGGSSISKLADKLEEMIYSFKEL